MLLVVIFMKILLALVLPTFLILTPTVFQITFTIKRIKDKTNLSIVIISLLTLAMGLPLSTIETWLSMAGLNYSNTSYQLVDGGGALTFLIFGIGLNLIMTLLIGIVGGFIHYKKNGRNI